MTAFADGGGFVIDRISTGDKVIATFLFDESDATKIYSMVYAGYSIGKNLNSQDPAKPNDASLWPMTGRQQPSDSGDPGPLFHRNVVIADSEGNSFLCEIKLYENSTESQRLLATIPCAPGLFGSTDIRNLRDTEGFTVDGVLLLPPKDDETGCSEFDRDSPTQFQDDDNEQNNNEDIKPASDGFQGEDVVQVVLRGDCAFYLKATLMKARSGAKAIIVINTEEEELFTMSGADPEHPYLTTDLHEFPGSILVTGLDGEDILSIANSEASGGRSVKARISVTKQYANFGTADKGTVSIDSDRWPVVKGEGKSLRVFARGGWGVKALYQEKKGRSEWQLQLMQYEQK